MPDGNRQNLSFAATVRERSVCILHPHLNRLADILEAHIANERSRQQSRFAKNLEAIADAQHQSSIGGKLADRFHHRRKLGNGSRT